MSIFKKYGALAMGVSLIILTNAIALVGVAYNRSSTPDSTLFLSERELSYNRYEHDDNSGVAVRLQWKVLSKDIVSQPRKAQSYDWYNYSREAFWLTDAKLLELGFDTTAPTFPEAGAYRYEQLKDREVFLVLELNGPSYQRYLVQARAHAKEASLKEEALRQIKEAEFESTRLFVIDAGKSADALRKRYPNRNMYTIVKGKVGAHWQSTDTKPVLNTSINSLSISQLHVPKPHDAVFTAPNNTNIPANYQVSVVYGQRYEPWVTGAQRTQ